MIDLTPEARRLVEAARAERAPLAKRWLILGMVQGRIAAQAPSGTSGATRSDQDGWGRQGGRLVGRSGAKTLLAALIVGSVGLSALVGIRRSSAPPMAPPALAPAQAPEGVTVPTESSPALLAAPPQARPVPGNPLARELKLLASARAALDQGDARRALALAKAHERRFPSGQLAEEGQALQALALCALNDNEAGSTAARFFQRWPRSPHAERLRLTCTEHDSTDLPVPGH
jgi:hypothetical protein